MILSFIITFFLVILSLFSPSFAADGIPYSMQGPGAPGTPGMPGMQGVSPLPSIQSPFDGQRGKNIITEEKGESGFERPPAVKYSPGKELQPGYTAGPSDFERYLSQRLELTAAQLDILRLQPGVKYSVTPVIPLPPGHAMFYISHELGGGFIVGTVEALSNGFKAAGIESPLYVSTEIKQFGYNLFDQPPLTFAPVDNVPVGPDYMLGPGDEVRIAIWGKVNAEYRYNIDKDGNINLPTVGVLPLAGLTLQEGKSFIEKEFSRYYTDLKINVSMGSLRSMRVFVVGNVNKPGSYTLSSFSTIINALFAAGGPGKVGSMRDIRLKRNGKTVVSLDLYDFLLQGDKTNDVRLMPEDVVFIPPVGVLAGIAGNVKVPAIYELKGETRLLDLINMAGGTNNISFKNRIQILRIEDGKEQILVETELPEAGKDGENNIPVKDGDLVKIFPVSQIVEKVVHITGAVKLPGTYGFTDGMTVKDILTYSGGLLRYANREEAELARVYILPEGPKTERINVSLQKALDGNPKHDIRLKEDDYIFIRTVPEWELYRTVVLSGEVKFPGTYTINKGETMSSLIERSGGYTDKAYLKGAVFTRESVRALQQMQLEESISRLEQEMLSQSARTIEAALSPEEAQQQKAVVEQRKNLIAKMRAAKAKGAVSIKLEDLKKFTNSPYNIPLEDGDTLYIPERPHQVQVMGAVYNPTAFVYNPDWTVSSYVKKAGGLTRNAEDDDIYILKMDGTAISKRDWSGLFNLGLRYSTLDPGDTIVVPEKIERIVWLREIKDLTQILYQIAVTAGVLIVAF